VNRLSPGRLKGEQDRSSLIQPRLNSLACQANQLPLTGGATQVQKTAGGTSCLGLRDKITSGYGSRRRHHEGQTLGPRRSSGELR
jgi:hypothetical protein